MAATNSSKRAVFQTIVDTDEKHWPYYRCPSTEYAANDLDALKHDVSTLAREWFQHDAHDDVETFICTCPLAYFEFASYDAFPDWHAQSKPVIPLLRAVMLMHLHNWEHETPLVAYLDKQEGLADALGFESVPSQATFWRARHERFSRDQLFERYRCSANSYYSRLRFVGMSAIMNQRMSSGSQSASHWGGRGPGMVFAWSLNSSTVNHG